MSHSQEPRTGPLRSDDALPPAQVLSVGDLNQLTRELLEGVGLRVWVRGEISDLARPPSGHVYFELRDEAARLGCVMYRSAAQLLTSEPAAGDGVLALGSLSLYVPAGRYQLIVERLEPVGLGAQALALAQLREQLASEGLLDPAKKRPLPSLPRRIGLVTSPAGAAFRDLTTTIFSRFPNVRVTLYPALVQGPEAPQDIARGIGLLAALGDMEVIVAGRGGGAPEDLAAFNSEIVARAIAACPMPVVSAVGHETDYVLSDDVADVRAMTPTAAGRLVVPEYRALQQQLAGLAARLEAALDRRHSEERRWLLAVGQRLGSAYSAVLRRGRARLGELAAQLEVVQQRRALERERDWYRRLSLVLGVVAALAIVALLVR